MKVVILIALLLSLITAISKVDANFWGKPVGNPHLVSRKNNNPFCLHDSIIIYYDCRMCTCPKPNRQAKCFKKSCDLRTKDSGQCPSAMLRLDDSKLCLPSPKSNCRIDNDCPGEQLCCFDFCRGSQCMNSIPLDPGVRVHGGRGYA